MAARATREIRERAAESGRVALAPHAQERMVERDIIMPELFRILREGTVRDDPERVGDRWKATMELGLPGGADAAAVAVIADGNGLRVVTVMWREAR